MSRCFRAVLSIDYALVGIQLHLLNPGHQPYLYTGKCDRVCEMTQAIKDRYLMCAAIMVFSIVPVIQLVPL